MTKDVPTSTELDIAANVLKSMADKTRFSILSLLRGGEMGVTAIASAFDRSAPTISRRLAKLHMADMVQTRKEGTSSFCSQPDGHLANLVVNTLHFAEHALYSNPSHHRAQ